MTTAFDKWQRERKREMRWEHSLHRYVTIGRRQDHLRAVWDAAKGHRISRWLKPENAERARDDCERGWAISGHVTGWILKIADGSQKDAHAEVSVPDGKPGVK